MKETDHQKGAKAVAWLDWEIEVGWCDWGWFQVIWFMVNLHLESRQTKEDFSVTSVFLITEMYKDEWHIPTSFHNT